MPAGPRNRGAPVSMLRRSLPRRCCRRSPHRQAESGNAREDLRLRSARSRAINGPGNSGATALLRFRREGPTWRVPHCDPFANSVVLDLNANKGKSDIELAVSIGVAHPGARQHVRSSFCLKDVGFLFPRDPTRPCCGAEAFRLREKGKFQEPWPQHVRNIEYLMRANDCGAEHDSKTVAIRAHETNRRVFDIVFVTTA